MYPTYCIAPTGQTNYITPPISLDDADCECYLWHCKYCEQSAQSIRVFLSGNIFFALFAIFPMPQIAFTIGIVQVDWWGNIISSDSQINAISRIQKVYLILCHIPSSGPSLLTRRLPCKYHRRPCQTA